jgi:hypothetical protein
MLSTISGSAGKGSGDKMIDGVLQAVLTPAQQQAGFSVEEDSDDFVYLFRRGRRVAAFGQMTTIQAIRQEADSLMKKEMVMRRLRMALFVVFVIIIFVPYVAAYAFTALAQAVFNALEPKPEYF